MFDQLNLMGGVILIDGNVEAFTIADKLNVNTALVVHIEKANTSIPELYSVINNEFCSHELNKFQFVNREQDLGLDGLRRAKMSYNPFKLIEKYKII